MKFQKGFTLTELIASLWLVFCIALAGFALYAVAHFINKFW